MGREQLEGATRDELIELVLTSQSRIGELEASQSCLEELEAQLRWFRQQLFGTKSERRVVLEPDPSQLSLGEGLEGDAPAEPSETTVRGHVRRRRPAKLESGDDPGLSFDETVPVQRIVVTDPEIEGLTEGVDYTVVGQKKSYRLAQQPAVYTVLEIVRPVIKHAETGALHRAPAPPSVLPGSYADSSLLAGMLVDKFRYHLPLYRPHQRMAACGITVSRTSLTNWVHQAVALLEPVYDALLGSILEGRVVAMDETPIRSGRKAKGKMGTGYFWPVYGERDEVAFPFARSRAKRHVEAILADFSGTLVSDGYEAYERYAAQRAEVTHALCWAHTRRGFVKAQEVEPTRAGVALDWIGQLYAIEKEIRAKGLTGEKKLAVRATQSKPIVEMLFAWLEHEMVESALLPTNPFTKAALYALERKPGLEVYLADPEVPIDTNHLERALRPIPMGRKNWLFCWTEVGAERVGQIQSLIATCVLHGVDPHTYLVDVLQRIDSHPMAEVEQLTPRRWKEYFATDPMRSLLDRSA